MLQKLLVITAALVLFKNSFDHLESLQKTTGYKVIKKDSNTEVRLYESGEKYRCTIIK